MIVKFKVAVGEKITSQEIEIDLSDELVLALGRRFLELETAEATKNGNSVSGEAVSIPAEMLLSDKVSDIEMTNYMRNDGCDLLTGESGTAPYDNCTECYRYDTCKKALESKGGE